MRTNNDFDVRLALLAAGCSEDLGQGWPASQDLPTAPGSVDAVCPSHASARGLREGAMHSYPGSHTAEAVQIDNVQRANMVRAPSQEVVPVA